MFWACEPAPRAGTPDLGSIDTEKRLSHWIRCRSRSRCVASSLTLAPMRVFSLAAIGLLALTASARAEAPTLRHVTRAELPAAIKPAGTLVDAVAWNDASGHNVAAFWLRLDKKKGTARLSVALWSGTPGT